MLEIIHQCVSRFEGNWILPRCRRVSLESVAVVLIPERGVEEGVAGGCRSKSCRAYIDTSATNKAIKIDR